MNYTTLQEIRTAILEQDFPFTLDELFTRFHADDSRDRQRISDILDILFDEGMITYRRYIVDGKSKYGFLNYTKWKET